MNNHQRSNALNIIESEYREVSRLYRSSRWKYVWASARRVLCELVFWVRNQCDPIPIWKPIIGTIAVGAVYLFCFILFDTLGASIGVALSLAAVISALAGVGIVCLLYVPEADTVSLLRDHAILDALNGRHEATSLRDARRILRGQFEYSRAERGVASQVAEDERDSRAPDIIRRRLLRTNWKAMRGIEFEAFLFTVLKANGYSVEMTQVTNDQGVDLIAMRSGVRIAIQVKAYTSSVGNKAVQEAFAGMAYYQCHGCAVITNSVFTSQALALSDRTNCVLLDESNLRDLILGTINLEDRFPSNADHPSE